MRAPGLLLLSFLILPFAEIFAFIRIGSGIGVWPVLIWVAATLFAGSALLAHQGRTMPLRLRQAVAEGRPPALEMIEGTLAWFGALLLLLPGFVTDAIGAVLLLPPLRRAIAHAFLRRMIVVPPPPTRREDGRFIETEWRRDEDDR